MTERVEVARAVAAAAAAVPGVARLISTGPVEVATQFPGGRVDGVRLASDQVEVQLALDLLPAPPVVAGVVAAVQAALANLGVPGRPVAVRVSDLDTAALPAAGGRIQR